MLYSCSVGVLLECVGVLEYLKECKIERVQKLEDCENG